MERANVIRHFERPSPDLVEGASIFNPATLHEAQGRIGALHSRIKPIYPGMKVCGPATTVTCHPVDNLMITVAISMAKPGDVLVVAAGGDTEQGLFGEVLTTACMAKGIVGIVTDGGVRDGPAIHQRGFNAFCAGLSIKGTSKETVGAVNHPVVVGGVLIRPGDLVSGDDDGVVIVRKEDIEEVCRVSAAREAKEREIMSSLEKGIDILELNSVRKALELKGCTYE